MALLAQALLLPHTDVFISNAQLHRLYGLHPFKSKWVRRRLVLADAAPRRKEPSKKISLDQHDLMALQFGRLLGEPEQKTISKVLRRKVDPGSTYVGIEKQAKGGKELVSNTDFAVKIEQPTRGSGNASTISLDLPHLASPPSRQNGSSLSFPKVGSKPGSYTEAEGIILDESLLRKPSSSQASRAALRPSTPLTHAVNNVERPGFQFKSALKEDSEDVEMLRRPSMAEEQAVEMFLDTQKSESNVSSQSEVASTLVTSDCMEASKLEFQRLLDKSFDSSVALSLPNLASPPVTQNNIPRESILRTSQQDSRLKLSTPKSPQPQTISSQVDEDHQCDQMALPSMLHSQGDKSRKEIEVKFQHKQNVDPSLPHLASPPPRHKGSVRTFVQPSRARNTAIPSSTKSSASFVLREPFFRKPKDQASDTTYLSAVEHSGDDELVRLSKASVQPYLYKPSAVPHLATPPSRHKGSFGTSVAPGRAKIRGVESPSKDPVDEDVEQFLLSKPSHLKERDSLDSPSLTEANTAPLLFSPQVLLEDQIINDDLLQRPSIEVDITQADVKVSNKLDGLRQAGGSQLGRKASLLSSQVSQDITFEQELLKGGHRKVLKDNVQSSDLENSLQVMNGSDVGQDGAHITDSDVGQDGVLTTDSEQESEPVFKTVTLVQSQEELSQLNISNGLDGPSQVINNVSSVWVSGGFQDVPHSSVVKSVKPAALKKPVRVSSSDSKVYDEGKSAKLDSSQALDFSSAVRQQSLDTNVDGKHGKLDIGSDLKSDQNEDVAEESIESQSSVEPVSEAQEPEFIEDQERSQAVHQQSAEAIGQTSVVLLDKEVAKEESTDNLFQQSKKILRRPSQLTHAGLSTHGSDRMNLHGANTELHQAKEEEEKEWVRAEALLKSKEQVEVTLIGSNSAGLFVSFGCLVGFLPSFELSPKRGLVDFASWAQNSGIDLSLKGGSWKSILNDGNQSSTVQNVETGKSTSTAEGDLNELKQKYKEEVAKATSSFVGEKTKVIVKLIDKSRRKLKFSEKEADPGCREHVQEKATLMAELKLGDMVTCEVKSITPIGVFVEVDGVPALIHHSEVSWNTRVEPAALLSIGQVIKAKVCRLDRTLQRINLSLKQMQTDPIKRSLESVIGDPDNESSMCELEAMESMDIFWPELQDLIKKLEKMDQISSASRGRCLYGAAFAPSFQVLISTPQSNGYTLLARFGNKIQEILVDTTLDRDKMKDCIRTCTFSDA